MAKDGTGKTIGLAFLIIMIAMFSALVIPNFFNNLVNQQNSSNREMFQAIRIIMIIFIVLVLGGSMKVFIWGDTNV